MDKSDNKDYINGQMMGMLCVVRLIRLAEENNMGIPADTFEDIERVAMESLSEYLGKPEEDVILYVDRELTKL